MCFALIHCGLEAYIALPVPPQKPSWIRGTGERENGKEIA